MRVVQEPDVKQSNAEAFIESVQKTLVETEGVDEEQTVIAANISELQDRVTDIQQQVREPYGP